MSNPQSFPETEPPQELSPESKALLKRARRSFGFSVVYRATRDDGPGSTALATRELLLPQGAEVISALTADGSVSVTYRIGGDTRMRIFEAATGAMTGEIAFAFE
jgi:hypothetical protein